MVRSLLCVLALTFGGCALLTAVPAPSAERADPDKLIPELAPLSGVYQATVELELPTDRAAHGRITRIDVADFAAAVETAIGKSRLFLAVGGRRASVPAYRLVLGSLTLDERDGAIRLSVEWTLEDPAGAAVYKDIVRTESQPQFGDSVVWAKRSRIAAEAAARENIKQALTRMSALAPPAPPAPPAP